MSSYGQGSTRNWRRTRQQVLDRDNYECQLRYPGCSYAATEVHHVNGLQGTPRSEADHPDICVSSCPNCHQQITNKQKIAAQHRANQLRRARRHLPQQPHPGQM